MSSGDGFTLRLVFEGICAYVPDEPFFYRDDEGISHPGNPSRCTVLLPDASITGIADWEIFLPIDDPCLRAAHAPILSFNPGDVADSKGLSIQGYFNDPLTGEIRAVHVLRREALTFATSSGEWEGLSFEQKIPKYQPQPLPGRSSKLRRSLWWLPRMSEISPHHEFCNEDLLTAPPGDFKKLGLASRITVPGGRLSTLALNQDGAVYWNFAPVARDPDTKEIKVPSPGDLTWKRAIGNRILCAIRVSGPEVELKLVRKGGRKASATLRPGIPGKAIEVRIANAELDALMLKPRSLPLATRLPDADFQALYPLTAVAYQNPLPAPFDSSTGKQPGIGAKPCSGVAFSGSGVSNQRKADGAALTRGE
jgi:hypothetical protein